MCWKRFYWRINHGEEWKDVKATPQLRCNLRFVQQSRSVSSCSPKSMVWKLSWKISILLPRQEISWILDTKLLNSANTSLPSGKSWASEFRSSFSFLIHVFFPTTSRDPRIIILPLESNRLSYTPTLSSFATLETHSVLLPALSL
jgi:hypothetical protein